MTSLAEEIYLAKCTAPAQLSVSVVQADVKLVSASLTTQLESDNWRKRTMTPPPELVAYTLTQSFSHASHRCGHDSLSPIAIYMVTGTPQYCDHLGPVP